MSSNNRQPIGAVMVVGGGVAGIKAAEDLASQGFYVYLVEKTPAIGGVMAQLDKTFPTNDCSMCILSPYLVATGRHPNIEIISYADIESVSGEPGHFKVKVRKRARSIHMDRCTGCRACIEACPVTQQAKVHSFRTDQQSADQ
jgi:heterodisulfide reductase subunit A